MSQEYLHRRVVLVPYDKNWQIMFNNEKEKILSVLDQENAIIEHIGSTAIPGLTAKPIIDIMVAVHNLDTANASIKPLETIEYEYVPTLEKDFPRRRFFHRGANLPNKHFHLHMVETDSDFWNKHLFFRDYLRAHRESLMEYQRLKEDLSIRFHDDVAKYCEAKGDFIQSILRKNDQAKNN